MPNESELPIEAILKDKYTCVYRYRDRTEEWLRMFNPQYGAYQYEMTKRIYSKEKA